MDEVQDLEELYGVQHDEVDLHTIIIDPGPDEFHIDDAAVTQCTEASTILHIPADGQHTRSICVKVDTQTGGNIIPLHAFQDLYPNQVRHSI